MLAGGNLGAPAEASVGLVEVALEARDRAVEDRLVQRLGGLLDHADGAERLPDPGGGLAQLLALGLIRAGGGLQHLPEARQPMAGLRREVGAAVERDALGVEEDGQRPATLAGHALDGLHVDVVDVGPLLAVDLDRDEDARSLGRRSPRPRRTRAPSRGTSGRRSSRSRAGSACPRSAALPSASGPHGRQSTGLSLCWSRYGLVSSASRLAISIRLPARRMTCGHPIDGGSDEGPDGDHGGPARQAG